MRSSCPASDPKKGRPERRLFILLPVMLATITVFTAFAAPEQQGKIDVRANEKDWRAEFDEICSFADGAMDMSREELESLLFRCNVLEPRISRLPETPKRVFGRKLHMCRDLYRFVLEQKNVNAAERNAGENAGAAGGEKSPGGRVVQ